MRQVFSHSRQAALAEAHAGFPARGGGGRAVAARAELARILWDADGLRRVPAQAALDRALSKLPPGELHWICEFSPLGPIYLIPTPPFLRALASTLRTLGATKILEVAAGDGHLSRALARVAPELRIVATDSGAWEEPRARMSAQERREHRAARLGGIPLGAEVLRLDAARAIRKVKPDLVLASWLPPGPLLSKLIRAEVDYVLELGAGSGVTGDVLCWRFAHQFCEGPLEQHARCRLDERPDAALHSRATLYFGRAHDDFSEERLGRDHWLRRLV